MVSVSRSSSRLENLFFHYFLYRIYRNALLKHTIAVSDRYGPVLLCLVVNRNAKRCPYCIHPAITFPDRIFFFIKTAEPVPAGCHEFPGDLRKTVFFNKRQYGQLHRCQGRREFQNYATVFLISRTQILFLVSFT